VEDDVENSAMNSADGPRLQSLCDHLSSEGYAIESIKKKADLFNYQIGLLFEVSLRSISGSTKTKESRFALSNVRPAVRNHIARCRSSLLNAFLSKPSLEGFTPLLLSIS
jgi:hypothetical protein